MIILRLALQSLVNRKTTALLTLLTIAISVALLLGVEQIRTQAKASFANTISGTDLIVGARSGQINLLLYSVFRIGNATNNIGWTSVKNIQGNKAVKWTIPLSLGDSHRGFRVIGTTNDYFNHYRYGQKQPLQFEQGNDFKGVFDAVIGAEVARKLGYQLGDPLVVAHGLSDKKFSRHQDSPFSIRGVLAPTGTPVDRGVYVSLAALDAIHQGASHHKANNQLTLENYTPEQITALLVGLKSKIQVFNLQRAINQYPNEPLTAILPGLALQELWGMMSIAEQALLVVSGFVVIAGMLGMLTSLLAGLNERRREMAILRAVGARPSHVFSLLFIESLMLTMLGIMLGIGLLYAVQLIAAPWILTEYGIALPIEFISLQDVKLLGVVLVAGALIGLFPAIRAYRQSLADGMSIRI